MKNDFLLIEFETEGEQPDKLSIMKFSHENAAIARLLITSSAYAATRSVDLLIAIRIKRRFAGFNNANCQFAYCELIRRAVSSAVPKRYIRYSRESS